MCNGFVVPRHLWFAMAGLRLDAGDISPEATGNAAKNLRNASVIRIPLKCSRQTLTFALLVSYVFDNAWRASPASETCRVL